MASKNYGIEGIDLDHKTVDISSLKYNELNRPEPVNIYVIPEQTNKYLEINAVPLSKLEVLQAIKLHKVGKATASDILRGELIKETPRKVTDVLTVLLNIDIQKEK